ncbi:MAG: metallophosphoesterase family protein [Solirubrobacteraceae bacterium]
MLTAWPTREWRLVKPTLALLAALAMTLIGTPYTWSEAAAASDPVLAAAGDIACPAGDKVNACKQAETAQLIESEHPGALAPLGDNQYEHGALSEFDSKGAYAETWGRFNSIVHPVPGNHEYDTPGAAGYFDYFGSTIAGTGASGGYYSYNLGAWHIVALNSNCSDIGCEDTEAGAVTSAELSWLRADLASHSDQCVLAYWHHPAFTSSTSVPNSAGVVPLWNLLYEAHADVVLNGHDHKYERFAQQDPSQKATSAGIREFVAGTGGESLFPAGASVPNLEALDAEHFGVLFLTLHAYSYEWAFRATNGAVLDSGSTACHAQPPPPHTPTPPPPPPPPHPPPKPKPLKFTAHVPRTVQPRALKRGLAVHVYCSATCHLKSVTVRIRRGHRTMKTIDYKYTKTISTHNGVLHLRLKGARAGEHLTLVLIAVSTSGERRKATTNTVVAR